MPLGGGGGGGGGVAWVGPGGPIPPPPPPLPVLDGYILHLERTSAVHHVPVRNQRPCEYEALD